MIDDYTLTWPVHNAHTIRCLIRFATIDQIPFQDHRVGLGWLANLGYDQLIDLAESTRLENTKQQLTIHR